MAPRCISEQKQSHFVTNYPVRLIIDFYIFMHIYTIKILLAMFRCFDSIFLTPTSSTTRVNRQTTVHKLHSKLTSSCVLTQKGYDVSFSVCVYIFICDLHVWVRVLLMSFVTAFDKHTFCDSYWIWNFVIEIESSVKLNEKMSNQLRKSNIVIFCVDLS